ncbi:MAG: Foldase protein PrsA 3 precursor [Deltaproteobacteria bacterium ADurb.Bin151]|nr:MAG: Foldase protein PrsA 3 precursor [Deltaproteobacteria bacterium ADurb.Bin151]
MDKLLKKNILVILFAVVLVVTTGCGKKEEAEKIAPRQPDETKQEEKSHVAENKEAIAPYLVTPDSAVPKDAVVVVDGVVLKKDDLAKMVKEKLNILKDKIPAGKKKEVEEGLKKQLMDEFILRTVLINEVNRRKIVVTDKEIQTAIHAFKANLPPDKTVEDFLRENKISKEDIALGIKIKKLVDMDAGEKAKPTDKEIRKFYTENKDKFTAEETVHVRHILVAIDPKDDEKTKEEKKARIESLRKQVVEGADFAEIAKNNSDCPSKENGGDLGEIKRGQTIKPFEDAAFSQEKNKIGPVVSTQFGHHVIQVLGHNPGKTVSLDEVKDRIAKHLEQQKQAEMFSQTTDRLRKKAVITYYKENEKQ